MQKKINIIFIFTLLVAFQANLLSQELTSYRNPFFGTMKYYQDADKISKQEVSSLMESSPAALEDWNRANDYFTYSIFIRGIGAAYGVWFVSRYLDVSDPITGNARNPSKLAIAGLFATLIPSIGFDMASQSRRNESILKYNDSLTYSPSLKIGGTENGIGLVLNF